MVAVVMGVTAMRMAVVMFMVGAGGGDGGGDAGEAGAAMAKNTAAMEAAVTAMAWVATVKAVVAMVMARAAMGAHRGCRCGSVRNRPSPENMTPMNPSRTRLRGGRARNRPSTVLAFSGSAMTLVAATSVSLCRSSSVRTRESCV